MAGAIVLTTLFIINPSFHSLKIFIVHNKFHTPILFDKHHTFAIFFHSKKLPLSYCDINQGICETDNIICIFLQNYYEIIAFLLVKIAPI